MLATYVHDLSSTLWESEKYPLLALRWYGLAYLAGFALAWLVIRFFAARGRTTTPREKIPDLIFITAFFGVFLGGRLGYMLLYDSDNFFRDPKSFFNFLGGGMASHGGIAGVMLATLYFAWRNRVPWTGVGDDLVVGAPLGLMTGRLANFINGELWGKETTASIGMKFPGELVEIDSKRYGDLLQLDSDRIVEALRADGRYAEAIAELPARHPSQLYQAGLEGLALFLILFCVRFAFPRLGHGVLTGLFFVLYAGFRIFGEHFREPDRGIEDILGLQRGQFYSLFMIVVGIAFLLWGTIGPGKIRRAVRGPGPEST